MSTSLVMGCPDQYGASHAVYYKGGFANLTATHYQCGGNAPQGWLYSSRVDLALIPGCPEVGYAMEVTNNRAVDKEMTDKVFAFGKIIARWGANGPITDRAIVCYVAGRYGLKISVDPFDGEASTLPDEFAINFPGNLAGWVVPDEEMMAGAIAINSCGYLGMIHRPRLHTKNEAILLPSKEIFQFLDDHFDHLLTQDHCPGVQVLEFPKTVGPFCGDRELS